MFRRDSISGGRWDADAVASATVAVFHKLGVIVMLLQLDSKQIVANSNQIFAVSKQI